MDAPVPIGSADFWVKVVGMLQQNWAEIDPDPPGGVRVFFFDGSSGVFDEIAFPSEEAARKALARNGFARYADSPDAQRFIRAPSPPFCRRPHPNGPICSSGRFWRP